MAWVEVQAKPSFKSIKDTKKELAAIGLWGTMIAMGVGSLRYLGVAALFCGHCEQLVRFIAENQAEDSE